MDSVYTVSLLFFATFSVCLFLGLYIFFLDMKNIRNQAFFAVCLALGIWSFSFSMAIAAADYESALAWRRFASLGWGTIFSLLLYFVLLFTGVKGPVFGKKWVRFLLLHVPSGIVIFVFGIHPGLASRQYNLVYTQAGWINIPTNTIWDWFFNFYYMGYSAIGCALLIWYGRRLKDEALRRQLKILLFAFLSALTMGTFTEMILNRFTSIHPPQMGPIFALIPLGTVFYLISKYQFLLPQEPDVKEKGRILSVTSRKLVYHILSMILFTGSILNFVVQFYLMRRSSNMVIVYSVFLFFVGFSFQILRSLHVSEKIKETILILIISIAVPVMMLRFLQWGSMTIWAAPMVFVVLSVVFNQKWILFGIAGVILTTQVVVWMNRPRVIVELNSSDYIVRIGIYILAIWVAHIVNSIYVRRLMENEEQIEFQRMVSEISSEFININEMNMDEKIKLFLRRAGEHFQTERALFISMDGQLRHGEWYKEGLKPVVTAISDMSGKNLSWWEELSSQDEVVCIEDVDMLPDSAEQEKAMLNYFQIRSVVAMPIFRKEQAVGFVFLGSTQANRICTSVQKELMKVLAHILTDGIVKVETQKEINHMAYYDALTGVANRSLFMDRLQQSMSLSKRNETIIAIIYIDLDSFKSVNDSVGHAGGNELLRKVAERLTACLRKNDTVARFGGDEFVIQANHLKDVEDVKRIADKILLVLTNPFSIGEQEFFVTASVGISIYPYDGDSAEELIRNADLAMYISKDHGKQQYTLCSSELKEDVLRKTKLTNRLYRAIDHNELELYYQPQVNAMTGAIIGYEALLRWHNKEFGSVIPSTFIPLAEQSGLILTLGAWVVEMACRQNKLWQDTGLMHLPVSVNLSMEQFRDRKIVVMIEEILKETGLEARYLKLEITERTAMEPAAVTMETLQALKNLGVSIVIDDFGTEYFSLNQLKILPIDQLKIDIPFIRQIQEGKKDKAIVRTIIQLAKNLEFKVIAEGVEDEEQYRFLKEEQCDEMQGYYFYKPMPAKELEKIWQDR